MQDVYNANPSSPLASLIFGTAVSRWQDQGRRAQRGRFPVAEDKKKKIQALNAARLDESTSRLGVEH
jgi:hypothetical protein